MSHGQSAAHITTFDRGPILPRGVLLREVDPRARILAAITYAIAIVSLTQLSSLALGLGISICLMFAARLPVGRTVKMVVMMDGFIFFMLAMLPFTTPGNAAFTLGPLTATWEGLQLAAAIALKANAVVMALLALVSTVEPMQLGHALHRLKLPENLVHLLLFTVRYIDVLRQEYRRLRLAMKARCFRARNTLHTYRSMGYLLGMMLVRSMERSERILQAMKCRGFKGRLYLLDDLQWHGRDSLFLASGLLICSLLVLTEFLPWMP